MKIQKVGKRGAIFSFQDEFLGNSTNVYVINGDRFVFICDTFLGPKSMEEVKNYLIEEQINLKSLIVFNSHSDWDHIWGNCAFNSATILSHSLCRENIKNKGEEKLTELSEHKQGNVQIILPNLVFQEALIFIDEEVEFFYTPGHTNCSASCYDRRDRILFAGDNIEAPIPYMNLPNFSDYSSTIQKYLHLDAKVIIPGHGELLNDKNLIQNHQDYVRGLSNKSIKTAEFTEDHWGIHFSNLNSIVKELKSVGNKTDVIFYLQKMNECLDHLKSPKVEEIRNEIKKEIEELQSKL